MPPCQWCQWGFYTSLTRGSLDTYHPIACLRFGTGEGVAGYISSHRMPPFRDPLVGSDPNARMPVMPVGYRLFLRMLSVRLVLLSFPSYILKKEWNWCNYGIDICDPNATMPVMPVMPVEYRLFLGISVWLAILSFPGDLSVTCYSLFSFLHLQDRVAHCDPMPECQWCQWDIDFSWGCSQCDL